MKRAAVKKNPDKFHARGMVFLLLFLVSLMKPSASEGEKALAPAIIPAPAFVERLEGGLLVSGNLTIIIPDGQYLDWRKPVHVFASKVREGFGIGLDLQEIVSIDSLLSCKGVILVNDAVNVCGPGSELPQIEIPEEEGYKLHVGENILIETKNPSGLHNALMTLFQLIDDSTDPPSIPACEIIDHPRFSWRGLMIDPARTFIPPDMVRRHLDLMAEFKLNVFHWHLTDDQGWRIESKIYPRLHGVGGPLHYLNEKKKKALDRHGWGRDGRGYYTREEIKEIVEYAADRQIMVVPEIDVPGHTSAMLAAYPELSCNGKGAPVRTISGGIYPTALCPGKEEVYEFLDALFAEVIELFPSPYFHVGGDEVAASDWMDYPPNQAIMAERGYSTRPELQGYFMERVNEILEEHGRTMIGWDEISRHAPEGVVIQAWRQHKYATQSADQGHQTIVSLFTPHYLNYSPFYHTLKANYTFEPIPKNLAPDRRDLIMGGEGCLWGRQPSIAEIEEHLFPRLMAQAEVLWSPAENRDWKDFLERLEVARPRMEKRGVEFGPGWRDLLDFHVIFTSNPEVNQ
jgi:hexosaminidase